MANYADLKAAVNAVIKTNGNQAITGQVLQNVLNTIISTIGENATLKGIAVPTTNPGTPDANVFYFASQAGTYTAFNGVTLDGKNLYILTNVSGNWVATATGAATMDVALQDTPFIGQGSEISARKFWADWMLAIEVPLSLVSGGDPYPNPTTGWSFAEGSVTPTGFNFMLYRSKSRWGEWDTPGRIAVTGSKPAGTGVQTMQLSNGIYITLNVDKFPTQTYAFSGLTTASAVNSNIWIPNYFASIRDYKNITELSTDLRAQIIEIGAPFFEKQINNKAYFTFDDARRIIKGLFFSNPRLDFVPYMDDTDYWTPAQMQITKTTLIIDLYEWKKAGTWGRVIYFRGNIPDLLASPERFVRVWNSNHGYLLIDVWELKTKIDRDGYLPMALACKYVIRRDVWFENYPINDIYKDMPLGMDRRTPFKHGNIVLPKFREAFLAVRYNGTVVPERGYGIVFIRVQKNGNLYFENYTWNKDGNPITFTSDADSFTIPYATASVDKIQYFKSPNGKYEILANFSKLYSGLTIPLASDYTDLIASDIRLEFEERVFAGNNAPSLIDTWLNNNQAKTVTYDPATGRQNAGYPDSLMINEEQRVIHEHSGQTTFNTYSVIQWCNVIASGVINSVTANVSYFNGRTRCVVKIFNNRAEFTNALDESVGTKIFDRTLVTSDFIDTSLKTARVYFDDAPQIQTGQIVGAIFIDNQATEGTQIQITHIFLRAPYDPIPGGTPFYWRPDINEPRYRKSVINADYAYYQLPLLINSKFPLEERVQTLEQKVEEIEVNSTNPRIVLPSRLYAIVGKEFNLYYDAFMLFPDLGTPQPNALFDISCAVGATNSRSFRLTPTAAQVGDYAMTVRVYDAEEHLIATKSTTLTVVPATNPSTLKRIFCIGDSTTDDTAQVVFGLRADLDDLTGGVSPVLVGHKPYFNNAAINHGAATGRTLGFYANGTTVLKFNFTGLPNGLGVYPNLTFSLPDGTGYIVNIETQVQNDGSGKGYSIADIWTAGSSPIGAGFTGQLKTNGAAGFPATVTVESTEQLTNWSPIRFNGKIDFAAYATHIGLAPGEKIDLFSIDLGINDSRGQIQSSTTRTTILGQAKALAEAFHEYNPNGIVMFCMTKSCANPRSTNSAQHDTYRMNVHALRENLIATFDNNPDYPYCCVSNSGVSIDRFFGYPISTVKAAARFNETIQTNGDDVHPRTEGYKQVADAMVGCMIYQLTK